MRQSDANERQMADELKGLCESLVLAAKSRGMTQGDLARRAGIAPETLSRIKSRGNAEFGVLWALARAVGMKFTLFQDNERREALFKRKLLNLQPIDYDN